MLTGDDNDMPGDLAQVHEKYGPMLLSAVAAVAKKGFKIPPEEGLELVHDFYVEALARVVERYDPSHGKFSTYLYAAFTRFARKRIARAARRKELFAPLDEAMKVMAPDEPAPAAVPDGTWHLPEVLNRLPERLRDILAARMLEGDSDRLIAARLSVSRYDVGQALAEALGRAAVLLDQTEAIRADLRPLALRLWRDEIPLTQVAEELRISRRAAGKRYRELLGTMRTAVAALENVWAARREAKHD